MSIHKAIGNVDAGAMFIGNFLDHGQAQAGAFDLGGDIGLEGALEYGLGKTRTLVQHA